MSIELMMSYTHLIFWHSLLLLPSIFPTIRVSSNESSLCIRWPKYWSFSLNISPSNDYSKNKHLILPKPNLSFFNVYCFMWPKESAYSKVIKNLYYFIQIYLFWVYIYVYTHSECIICKALSQVLDFFFSFFQCRHSVVSASLVENYHFSQRLPLVTLLKIN